MANSKYCNPKSIQMIEKQQKKVSVGNEAVCTPPLSINTTRVNSSKQEMEKHNDRIISPYDAYASKVKSENSHGASKILYAIASLIVVKILFLFKNA